MWYVIKEDELYHHGVKGQKWGKRRFQNYDMALTPEGRRRYESGEIGASVGTHGNGLGTGVVGSGSVNPNLKRVSRPYGRQRQGTGQGASIGTHGNGLGTGPVGTGAANPNLKKPSRPSGRQRQGTGQGASVGTHGNGLGTGSVGKGHANPNLRSDEKKRKKRKRIEKKIQSLLEMSVESIK